ncbi:hypothetical protein [Rufibacter roseus]|uniref:Uncharacterized protein n=1 Tax=Rufibacter roseus TaxID=1567108 RepID=A0ABW2DK93_9BACT|nr:hypothetical protein [Rufibacter roseus]
MLEILKDLDRRGVFIYISNVGRTLPNKNHGSLFTTKLKLGNGNRLLADNPNLEVHTSSLT